MKFEIEGPPPIEAKSSEIKDGKIVTVPALVSGHHIIKAAHITAQGDGGTETKAVILFNANTGEFTLRNLSGAVKFDFDKPLAEFKSKRAAAKTGTRKQVTPSTKPPTLT